MFLSCLCGSELDGAPEAANDPFLSCLCGSEPPGVKTTANVDFLSCLCGSEHKYKTKKYCINKDLCRYWLFHQFLAGNMQPFDF